MSSDKDCNVYDAFRVELGKTWAIYNSWQYAVELGYFKILILKNNKHA